MIKSAIVTSMLLGSVCMGAENNSLEYAGVMVKDGKKDVIVKREIPDVCNNKILLSNKMVWTGNYAHPDVPDVCKSTFVHTTGKLQPMHLYEDLETYGELETLAFIKEMQHDENMLLIDSRKEKWYNYMSIPGAINMPFYYFKDRDAHEFEFEYALRHMGVQIIDNKHHYNFDHAKTLLIFCNGAWCGQSPMMINALIEIGYPPENIKWYRGGMQSWLGAGMTARRIPYTKEEDDNSSE